MKNIQNEENISCNQQLIAMLPLSCYIVKTPGIDLLQVSLFVIYVYNSTDLFQ